MKREFLLKNILCVCMCVWYVSICVCVCRYEVSECGYHGTCVDVWRQLPCWSSPPPGDRVSLLATMVYTGLASLRASRNFSTCAFQSHRMSMGIKNICYYPGLYLFLWGECFTERYFWITQLFLYHMRIW